MSFSRLRSAPACATLFPHSFPAVCRRGIPDGEFVRKIRVALLVGTALGEFLRVLSGSIRRKVRRFAELAPALLFAMPKNRRVVGPFPRAFREIRQRRSSRIFRSGARRIAKNCRRSCRGFLSCRRVCFQNGFCIRRLCLLAFQSIGQGTRKDSSLLNVSAPERRFWILSLLNFLFHRQEARGLKWIFLNRSARLARDFSLWLFRNE